jgi:hypothetical protein
MENVSFQRDRRNVRASSCLAASAAAPSAGEESSSHNKDRIPR